MSSARYSQSLSSALAAFAAMLITGCAASPSDSAFDHSPGFRPDDYRRVIPNNPIPPEHTKPEAYKSPLSASHEGVIRSVETKNFVIALTLDLCELETVTTGYDAALIDYLREAQVPATLFMGGKWMRTHAVRAKQLLTDSLFEAGNHAWSHGNFAIMSAEAMAAQIDWTEAEYESLRAEILEEASQKGIALNLPETLPYLRYPYGRSSETSLKLATERGLETIQWDVAGDSVDEATPEELGRAIANRIKPGSIILFHANLVPKHAAGIVRAFVEVARDRGYRFVSVTELLKHGTPYRTREGYFERPGDNWDLDDLYGIDGTGRKAGSLDPMTLIH